jgi:hypothetical protein
LNELVIAGNDAALLPSLPPHENLTDAIVVANEYPYVRFHRMRNSRPLIVDPLGTSAVVNPKFLAIR